MHSEVAFQNYISDLYFLLGSVFSKNEPIKIVRDVNGDRKKCAVIRKKYIDEETWKKLEGINLLCN